MPFFTRKNKKPLGIYIHIPFCRSKCQYCDFYSVTAQEQGLWDAYRLAICEHIVTTMLGVLDGKEMPQKTVFTGELVKRETTR